MTTERIELGIVGLSASGRHPGLLAMELASLNQISGGRVRVQVGTGDSGLAASLGKEIDKPLAYTRSLVAAIRSAMSGRKFSVRNDQFAFDSFKLNTGAGVPPIDVMAIRPQMVKLACEVGDGLSLSMGAHCSTCATSSPTWRGTSPSWAETGRTSGSRR
jgi:5,10-methylenetetrahydromethanopterin reductase